MQSWPSVSLVSKCLSNSVSWVLVWYVCSRLESSLCIDCSAGSQEIDASAKGCKGSQGQRKQWSVSLLILSKWLVLTSSVQCVVNDAPLLWGVRGWRNIRIVQATHKLIGHLEFSLIIRHWCSQSQSRKGKKEKKKRLWKPSKCSRGVCMRLRSRWCSHPPLLCYCSSCSCSSCSAFIPDSPTAFTPAAAAGF